MRQLGCISGSVITASHNPREYNGYKVYWEDGAQITPPHDKNILEEVATVTEFSQVKTMACLLYTSPLTSIINYVDLLKRENIQDPRIKGYIEIPASCPVGRS